MSTSTTVISPPGNCKFAIPKKGRLFEKVKDLLKGAGIEFRREPRLDVALCVGLPLTLVFLPASDIAKYVAEGNVDIGITGLDVVEESNVVVDKVMDLGFGGCRLCVQAPVSDKITDVSTLAGGRIVTSFPFLAAKFFKKFDEEKGVKTKVTEVSGSVEAACGLGLADAVVDLVETGTTMKVSLKKFFVNFSQIVPNLFFADSSLCSFLTFMSILLVVYLGCWIRSCC
jgi:ATP phosphoribosyltransferase